MGQTRYVYVKIYKFKKKFNLFNKGEHYRDFTYIKDVNLIFYKLLKKRFKGYNIFNVCSNNPIKITKIIQKINSFLDKKNVKIKKLGLQRADVIKTHGDNKKIKKTLQLRSFTSIDDGILSLIDYPINQKFSLKKKFFYLPK